MLRHRCAVFEFRCAERLPDILPKYLDKIIFVLCLIASFSLFHAHIVRTSLYAAGVVLSSPPLDCDPRFGQRGECLPRQQFASEYPSNDSW